MFDIADVQRRINKVTKLTYAQAIFMVGTGQGAIIDAIRAGANLPGQQTRSNVKAKIDALLLFFQGQAAGGKADQLIGGANLLEAKKWTVQAFIEANAVGEGAKYAEQIRAMFLSDLAESAGEVAGKVAGVASVGLILAGAVGLLLLFAYLGSKRP